LKIINSAETTANAQGNEWVSAGKEKRTLTAITIL
jgi:hypothetical protein